MSCDLIVTNESMHCWENISSHITNNHINYNRIKNSNWQEVTSWQFTTVLLRIWTLADRECWIQLEVRVGLKLNPGSWDCKSSMLSLPLSHAASLCNKTGPKDCVLLWITQKPVQTRNVFVMLLCTKQASMRTLPNSKLSITLPVKLSAGPRDTTMSLPFSGNSSGSQLKNTCTIAIYLWHLNECTALSWRIYLISLLSAHLYQPAELETHSC